MRHPATILAVHVVGALVSSGAFAQEHGRVVNRVRAPHEGRLAVDLYAGWPSIGVDIGVGLSRRFAVGATFDTTPFLGWDVTWAGGYLEATICDGPSFFVSANLQLMGQIPVTKDNAAMIVNPSASMGWVSSTGFGISGSAGANLWVAGESGVAPWAELAVDQRLGESFSLGLFARTYFLTDRDDEFFKFPVWPVGGVAFKTTF